MKPLTHQTWEQHYVELRPHIVDRFPGIDTIELSAIGDDYDGLLALVQRAADLSSDAAQSALTKLDVEELGLGAGRQGEPDDNAATLDNTLVMGHGFTEDERPRVIERLVQLNRHLQRFPADASQLVVRVNGRDTSAQALTLEANLPGFHKFVATSKGADLRDALADVRHDLARQLETAVEKRSGRGR